MLVNVAQVIAPDLHAQTTAATPRWCDDPANIAMLIRWLGCKGLTNNWDADDYAYVCDKGHKWQHEWDELQAELAKAEEADGA